MFTHIYKYYRRLKVLIQCSAILKHVDVASLKNVFDIAERVYPGIQKYLYNMMFVRHQTSAKQLIDYINEHGTITKFTDYFQNASEEEQQNIRNAFVRAFHKKNSFEGIVILLTRLSKLEDFATVGHLLCDVKDNLVVASIKLEQRTLDDWKTFVRHEQEMGHSFALGIVDRIDNKGNLLNKENTEDQKDRELYAHRQEIGLLTSKVDSISQEIIKIKVENVAKDKNIASLINDSAELKTGYTKLQNNLDQLTTRKERIVDPDLIFDSLLQKLYTYRDSLFMTISEEEFRNVICRREHKQKLIPRQGKLSFLYLILYNLYNAIPEEKRESWYDDILEELGLDKDVVRKKAKSPLDSTNNATRQLAIEINGIFEDYKNVAIN